MKKLSFLLLVLATASAMAQSPEAFKYQAIARDNGGLLLANQNVGMRISILESSASGPVKYSETHAVTSNQFGLVNLDIGTGGLVSGNFSTIDWGNQTHFLKIEMDASGGTSYQLMGTAQLVSVPYALHAKTAATVDNADDADADPLNEIQDLQLAGNNLTITNNGTPTTINLSSYLDNTDGQMLGLAANNLSITGGNSVSLASYLDNTDGQTLSIAGSNLTISGGNTVVLPAGGSGANTLDASYDQGGPGAGRIITADAGAVNIATASPNSIALDIDHTNTGVGVAADNTNAANTFSAIQANTNSFSAVASAVVGNTTSAAWGVSGQVAASATAQAALYGSNLRTTGGHGVLGIGVNGVVGETNYSGGYGVYGENFETIGPVALGVGVAGKGFYGVLGEDRYAGGSPDAYGVYSNGDLAATGVKSFHIDHPLDPAGKYLNHFSIESNEVLNIYRGNTTFDASGEAIVELPQYFSSININYSYHLTPIGAFAPVYIKEKISENHFTIAGGTAGQEVSWTVQAERNDKYLQAHPEKKLTEIEKGSQDYGKFLIPALYDAADEKGVFHRNLKRTVQVPLQLKE